jgi:phytoene synthase
MSGIHASPVAPPPAGGILWCAWLYTPVASRPVMAAFLALAAELRSVVAATVDHGVSHLKLQWWKDEIHRLGGGQPRHPLTQALWRARPDIPHAWRPLQDAISSLEFELASASYESERELDDHFARAAGFCRALSLALGPARETEPVERLGRALGKSIRMVEVIRDLQQDAAMGRVFLPLDWLEEHGITHVELRSEDGGDGTRRCLARLAERARSEWSSASDELALAAAPELRGLRVLGALHATLLERIASTGFAVGRRQITLGALDGLWTAWRAARQH